MRIVFANMPFSSARPAMGVSLLKGHLDQMGVESRIEYFNMRFGELAGAQVNWYISELALSQMMAGEYVFAPEVFPRLAGCDDAYASMVHDRFEGLVTGRMMGWIQHARGLAGPFIEQCLDAIDWASYDLVGFTTTFNQNMASLALAKRLKARHPKLLIAFGGANCEHTLGLQLHRSFEFIDFVSSGEADISFPRLVRALMDGGTTPSIPGIISREGGESVYVSLSPPRIQNLDSLPHPNFDEFFELHEQLRPTEHRPAVVMETSRGCWWGEKHQCTFCGLNGLAMNYRSKSAERALEECSALTRRYRTQQVEMVDNILDMAYLRTFLPELAKLDLGVDLFYETKANLTKQQLQVMRAAGITALQPGIESLSTQVLKIMDKGTTGVQNLQMLKWCKEVGIRAYYNILYGFPGEDPDEYRDMVGIMDAVHHLDAPQSSFAIRLDRFSPHFDDPAAFGLSNVRPDRSYDFVYDLQPSEVAELAYYFEHAYDDGRDPESYTGDLRDAVERWTAAAEGAEPSTLSMRDDGTVLAIADRRDGRKVDLELGGYERDLCLACDTARPLTKVIADGCKSGLGDQAIRRTLSRLVDDGLILHLDGRVLMLAVPVGSEGAAPEPEHAQRQLAGPKIRVLTD